MDNETVWSIAMELTDKLYEQTKDLDQWRKYRERLTDAYWKEREQSEKNRKEELEHLCGRSTFYPYEL